MARTRLASGVAAGGVLAPGPAATAAITAPTTIAVKALAPGLTRTRFADPPDFHPRRIG